MKLFLYSLLTFVMASVASAAPFKPLEPDEAYGVGSTAWRFASTLSKDAVGVIEICYAEEGSPEQVIGRVDVRPFRSSASKMPDLRVLFTKAKLDGSDRVVLIVGYGIRSDTFVVEIPGLTSHSLSIAGSPHGNSAGEYTLLGFGSGGVMIKADGMEGVKGRLFFRYIEKGA